MTVLVGGLGNSAIFTASATDADKIGAAQV